MSPMPTEEISSQFNELRNDMLLLYELKMGLSSCEFELQTLKHQYEAVAPGKVCGTWEKGNNAGMGWNWKVF